MSDVVRISIIERQELSDVSGGFHHCVWHRHDALELSADTV